MLLIEKETGDSLVSERLKSCAPIDLASRSRRFDHAIGLEIVAELAMLKQ